MLRNFLLISLRNLTKNGVFSFINIFGLAVGMTSCVLIMLWTEDEKSYNLFHEHSEHIYSVKRNVFANDEIVTDDAMPLPSVEALRADAGIRYVVPTDWAVDHLLNYKDQKVIQTGMYVGQEFLQMFTFPLRSGSIATALKDPSAIVLTASTAEALFGKEDPMGKVVRLDDIHDMTVTGVLDDVPSNSSLSFHYLMPFSAYENAQPWVRNVSTQWETNAFLVYIQLHDAAAINDVAKRNKNLIKQNATASLSELYFHPLKDWRLLSRFSNGQPVGGSIEFINSLIIVGGFILLIACINFMNLATARSERRAREVGIRKTIGSMRIQLIAQFILESILIAAMAFILAVGFTEISLPFFNNIVGRDLTIPYDSFTFWKYALIVVFICGVVAGSYPAFYLSSFSPGKVLKGLTGGRRSALPRKILVSLQFSFTIFQIVGTIVFYQQIKHGMERSLGYDRDNLLMIDQTKDITKNITPIKEELLSQGLITSLTSSNSPITSLYAHMNVTWPGRETSTKASFATVAVSYDYMKTMGIQPIEGRDFDPAHQDSASVIINETAAKLMNLEKPLGERVLWDDKELTIVGVVPDIMMTNPYAAVDPTMFIFDPSWVSHYTLRIPKGKDLPETLAKIETIFKKYNPAYPFTYAFADEQFDQKFSTIRFIGTMANIFSFLAIVISCLGLFGLAAFTAEKRTKEIGIRKVLGASVTQMVMLLSREFSKLVFIAFLFTAPMAWFAFNMWLNRFPYRIDIHWMIIAGAGIIALALALITVSSQALRAALANPVNALKRE
ncbi:ABC transporter permease [Pseudochryseolinea flava]|uniref:ABC transporter permease n=1 Tax=Pseudochryseolinea flava TaxID=2059302 RepID=A0A364Y251_9BACT|nr:ABC transporter permease [Pseudochryseolinea flava]RAW00720.1 ABC transporter permease [Pseudochryseolinea flava]